MDKKARASDRLRTSATEDTGFVLRKNTPVQALVRLFMMITVLVAWVAVLVYFDTVQGVVLPVGMGCLIFYIARKLEAQEAIQVVTEFTNALLASAIGDGYAFCAIAWRDGSIVYINRAFQEAFPSFMEQPRNDLKTLLNIALIAEADGQKLTSLSAEGVSDFVSTEVSIGAERRSKLFSSVRSANPVCTPMI